MLLLTTLFSARRFLLQVFSRISSFLLCSYEPLGLCCRIVVCIFNPSDQASRELSSLLFLMNAISLRALSTWTRMHWSMQKLHRQTECTERKFAKLQDGDCKQKTSLITSLWLMQDLYLFNNLSCLFNIHDDKFSSLFNLKVYSSSGNSTKRFTNTFQLLQLASCKILHNFVTRSCSTNCETIFHLHLWRTTRVRTF